MRGHSPDVRQRTLGGRASRRGRPEASSGTNLNSGLDGGRLPGVHWDTKAGTVFDDVAPTP